MMRDFGSTGQQIIEQPNNLEYQIGMFSDQKDLRTDSCIDMQESPPNRENNQQEIVRWIRDVDLSEEKTEETRRRISVKDSKMSVRTDDGDELKVCTLLPRYNSVSQTGQTKFILLSLNPILSRAETKKLIREALPVERFCRLLGGFTGDNLLFNLLKFGQRDIFNITVKHMAVEVAFYTDHECTRSCFTQNGSNSTGCPCEKVLSVLERILNSKDIQFFSIIVAEEDTFCRCTDGLIPVDYRNVSELLDIELEFENNITLFLSEGFLDTDDELSKGPMKITAKASSSLSRIARLRHMHRTLTNQFIHKLGTIVGTKSTQRIRRSESRVERSQDQLEQSAWSMTSHNRANNVSHRHINDSNLSQKSNPKKEIPTSELLDTVSRCLTEKDWPVLREELSYNVPPSLLDQLDEKNIFNELLEKKYIDEEKLDYIRELFYNIRRVDLVHVIDCWAEGDDSYLGFISQLVKNETTRTDKTEANIKNGEQHCASGINRSSEIEEVQSDGQRLGNDCSKTRLGNRITRTRAADLNPSIKNETTATDETEDNTKHDEQPCAAGVHRSSEINEVQSDGHPLGNDCSEARPAKRITRTRADCRHPSISAKEHSEPASTTTKTSPVNSHYKAEPKVSCEHYDRLCTVKFACCEEFWACHRCHNSRSKCGQKKLKACDTEYVKCNRCGKVQEFPTEKPHCIECNLKFSEYFCSICKHLTGTNNKPYHCKDCGICRVSKDNSFHCNTCGYCMDLSLKWNHKCRPNSAHDSCFICLEDAFSGCQILPCSHKVHRDCAQKMLRQGITRCPVCRESFAHKIDRRPSCK